jgi:tetratricopeptide (TPR) repeat protein
VAEVAAFKYRAFLSYSHRDQAWCKWLHSALEGYRIDKDLVGRETSVGPAPRTLRPIFRDREDFSAGHSLTQQTLAALEASQFLIVICSPNSAQSQYVDEEIRRFKALGRADRVIPLIVDGEPGDPTRECFPPALRFKLGPDGRLTEEREEPIEVQGSLDAALKNYLASLAILEHLVAIKPNEIYWLQNLPRVLDKVALVFEAQGKTDEALELHRKLLALTELFAAADPSDRWLQQILSTTHNRIGDLLLARDAVDEALEHFRTALAIRERLALAEPQNTTRQRDLALAYSKIAGVLLQQGKLDEAIERYRASLVISERLPPPIRAMSTGKSLL